ncbi:MAG: 3-deoxy-8-phosphooctulonate synthase, partial [Nanoarchaeota archaeon]
MILIAGPCIIESEDILKDTVEKLLEAIEDKNIDFYFKSSFKKDNRTSLDGFRGLPVREALGYLQNIKK